MEMPPTPKFKPLETPQGWMVSIPVGMSSTKKREKRFFHDPKEAERFAKKLRGDYAAGRRGGTISPELARMAADADELLRPHGITILEAAKATVARLTSGTSETFAERWQSFTTAQQEHWRGRYYDDMLKIPRWVPQSFLNSRLSDLTPEIVRAAIIAGGASAESTIKARTLRINSVIHGRGNKRQQGKITLLTWGQCGKLLRACQNPEERRAVALLLFAGIRPSAQDGEISRLDWENVGETEIYVPTDVSKTGADRHIPITPRLRRLIKGHPATGPVIPAWWKVRYQRIRKAADLGSAQDSTRHTFASHFLAAFGPDKAKSAMGHTAGSDTLFRHYRRAVTEETGKRYFGLANR